MLIKLANTTSDASKGVFKRIGSFLEKKFPIAHKEIGPGIALTGGIAGADAITRASFAKPGERKRAALEGLAQGAVYGGALTLLETPATHGINKLLGFATKH